MEATISVNMTETFTRKFESRDSLDIVMVPLVLWS